MVAIVPQPSLVKLTGLKNSAASPDQAETYKMSHVVIGAPGATRAVAETLAEQIEPGLGQRVDIHTDHGKANVALHIDGRMQALGPEAYHLTVNEHGVEMTGASETGLYWATQTFRQLLSPALYRRAAISNAQVSLPFVEIEDSPRFRWRGIHMDVGRHFMRKSDVLRMIDLASLHKLNVLHFHLTEDQGWRFEVKRFPKLTEIGAWRKETVIGRNSGHYDGIPHGGFYTQDDLREIVAFAKRRHVTVVPEIEMPGHAQAAIASYPEWGEPGKPREVWTMWGVSDNVYNVEDSTIRALQQVLDEVLEIFPSEFIHVGGDECPKTQWKSSPRTQELMRQRGLKDEEELQSWFIGQMDHYLTSKGRRLLGWDEILEGGLAPGATVMSWRGMEGGIAAAKAGHDVVMAPVDYTYFDHYQSKKASEPLAIGGFLPLSKVYEFEPVDPRIPEDQAVHVLGLQGQLWSEYIPDFHAMEYMAFPRACALAEVGWCHKKPGFDNFMGRLEQHLARLSAMDVNYRALGE